MKDCRDAQPIYSAKILLCYREETHKNVEAFAEHIFNL